MRSWRSLIWASAALIGLGMVGCYNSESDYQALLEENNTLIAELEEARKENEILTRALDNIKQEEEALQRLLNAGRQSLTAGRIPRLSASSSSSAPVSQAQAPAAPDWTEEWQTPRPAESSSSAPAAGAEASPGGYYVVKPGDVLLNIAIAHNTTVDKILELNPKLRSRRNFMIYDNDRLRMP